MLGHVRVIWAVEDGQQDKINLDESAYTKRGAKVFQLQDFVDVRLDHVAVLVRARGLVGGEPVVFEQLYATAELPDATHHPGHEDSSLLHSRFELLSVLEAVTFAFLSSSWTNRRKVEAVGQNLSLRKILQWIATFIF